ncbi:SRPBCC family protein [Arthrobacter sp. Soil763]|uniref:SRPBCC family protein n=1 Tax=Arthrobacter sp. Soil763 TaxID=1736402 RepID=UPI000700813A|nr:SRPBCC family protein [Arthrobacter sp. Soil763]KRE79210.1 hypothetical protein ASG71_03665 [Arthrobacter sp. Soil763]
MAFAEYEVVIERDAMSIYTFLLDPRNLASWRTGIRGVKLISGAAGATGAVYRPLFAGTGGPADVDFALSTTRPGAEIEFQAIAGRMRVHGGYYLSTEGSSTRVRFALRCRPAVAALLSYPRVRRAMLAQVAELEQLKSVLEPRLAAA